MVRLVLLILGLALAVAPPVWAQGERTLELEGQVTTLTISEFDTTDVGVGVQAGWRTGPVLAIDGTLALFPGDGRGRRSLQIDHQRKVLGLVGVRARAEFGRTEAFVRARPGFLRFTGHDRTVCIALAVFPLPLACRLLAGETVFAAELGGGGRVSLTDDGRAYLSLEVSDVLLRYAGGAWRPRGEVADDAFISHNARVAVGLGWRF